MALAEQIIAQFEGFRETPYWDVNAYRTGYGSDTITLADGSIVPVRQGMTVTREDAQRDLTRRTGEFASTARGQLGEAYWNSLSEPQRAALTSIAYNYGSLPKRVVNAALSGGNVDAAIRGLGSDNEGINQGRRNREADIFSGSEVLAAVEGSDVLQGGEGEDDLAQPQNIQSLAASLLEDLEDVTTPDASVAEAYQSSVALDLQGMAASLLDAPTPVDPLQPRITEPAPEAPNEDRFSLDLTSETAAPMTDLASQAFQGFTGSGPSVAATMFPEGTPQGVKDLLSPTLDLALSALGAAGALPTGAAGFIGDMAEAAGMSPNEAQQLARDLAAMPDAFAGSPQSLMRPATQARQAGLPAPARVSKPATTAARIEPPISATQKPPATPQEVGSMARTAATGGLGSKKAAHNLAKAAKVDPDAAAAAKRLDIDLPMDVFADDTSIKEAVGLTRSIAGSQASAEWRDTVTKAITRADDVMREIDGSPDLSDISDRTFRTLQKTVSELDDEAVKIYDAVDDAIPRRSTIEPNNMVRVLNESITDLGGVEGLTPAEANLFKVVTSDQPVTYERLMRFKRDIGRAVRKGDGPFADADQALLKRVYGAIVDDQMDNVERLGGVDLRNNLELANQITTKKKALEATITDAFGKDLEGSIAGKLRTAITQGSKGNVSGLNRVLSAIPEDLRGEAVVSAISSLARTTRAGDEGFGFAQYAKLYSGLRENSQVYRILAKEIGPERAKVLQDMYVISKKITEARGNVITTGKANQALVQNMLAEGIVEKVFNKTAGRAIGLATGSPTAAMGGAVADLMTPGQKVSPKRVEAASALFRSPQFQKMMIEAAETGQVSANTVNRVAKTGPFKNWAKQTGITDPRAWIAATVSAGQAEKETSE